jgi:hypothetical protein
VNIKFLARKHLAWGSISHGSMKNVKKYYIKRSKPNCSGYGIEAN